MSTTFYLIQAQQLLELALEQARQERDRGVFELARGERSLQPEQPLLLAARVSRQQLARGLDMRRGRKRSFALHLEAEGGWVARRGWSWAVSGTAAAVNCLPLMLTAWQALACTAHRRNMLTAPWHHAPCCALRRPAPPQRTGNGQAAATPKPDKRKGHHV